jgi:hypothetical protein
MMMMMMMMMKRLDENASRAIFNYTHRSALLKSIADLISMSCDEATCFPGTAVVGFISLGLASTPDRALVARRVLRLFGDFGAVCLFESALKLYVRFLHYNGRIRCTND